MSKLQPIVAIIALLAAGHGCGTSKRPRDRKIIDVRPSKLQLGDKLIVEGKRVVAPGRHIRPFPAEPTFHARVPTFVTLQGTFTYPGQKSNLTRNVDGAGWAWDKAPCSDGLLAVWGSTSSAVFAAGNDGVILRHDGRRWRSLDSGTGANLRALWGFGEEMVFAAGDDGVILRYDGKRWRRTPSGTTNTLTALWGNSTRNLWAVGLAGTVLRFDGQTWQPVPSPTKQDLHAIWGTDAGNMYVAGASGVLARFTGRSWQLKDTKVTATLRAIWGGSASDFYVAGDEATLLRTDGEAFRVLEPPTTRDLHALWGRGPRDVYAAGEHGTILHFDGARWSAQDAVNGQHIAALWGTGAVVHGVISQPPERMKLTHRVELPAYAPPTVADPGFAERVVVPMTARARELLGYSNFVGRVGVTQRPDKGGPTTVWMGSDEAPVELTFFKPSMKSLAQLVVGWVSHDRVLRWLGVEVEPVADGLEITSVEDGAKQGQATLAARAGLQEGDVITRAGAVPARSPASLTAAVRKAKKKSVMALSVKRGGRELTKRIPMMRKPLIIPTSVIYLVVMLMFALVALTVALVTAGLLTWLERRVAGRIQSRVGPNRVGPLGLLQWLADGIKLLLKEDVIPDAVDRPLFKLAPYLVLTGLLGTFVVLPFGQFLIISDLNIGVLYLVAITGFVALGLMMAGWSSNNKWALLGGMRSAAQIISYEIPAGLALMVPVILAGSLSTQTIIERQGGWPWQWFMFDNPFAFICFFIYFISALAEGNRTPFDLPEAESELVAGYQVEYSGWRFAVFMLSEWANVFVIGAVSTTVFLGGWQIPGVSLEAHAGWWVWQVLGLGLFVVKALALVFVIIWIRWTLPRLRVDQMMRLCWQYFVPWTFASIIVVALWSWAAPAWLRSGTQWVTFAVCGVGLLGLFLSRVMYNWRNNPEDFSWKVFY